jgi:hypothetical protein
MANNNNGDEGKAGLLLYPNPATDVLSLDAYDLAEGVYNITLLDLHGRPVYNKEVVPASGRVNEKLSLTQFAAGLYFVQFRGPGINTSRKIEKVR